MLLPRQALINVYSQKFRSYLSDYYIVSYYVFNQLGEPLRSDRNIKNHKVEYVWSIWDIVYILGKSVGLKLTSVGHRTKQNLGTPYMYDIFDRFKSSTLWIN